MFVGNVENSTNSNSKALEIFIFIPINEKEKWDLVGAFFVYECELAFIFTFVYLCWLCFLSITLTSDKTPHDQLFSFIALNRWLFFWIILVIACKLENCMLCKKWRKTFWNQREKSIIWWCQLRKPVKFCTSYYRIASDISFQNEKYEKIVSSNVYLRFTYNWR